MGQDERKLHERHQAVVSKLEVDSMDEGYQGSLAENLSTTVDSHRSSRRSLGPEKLTPGKLGRSKSAVELPKATLHSALTQMAAVLRVAKEGEVRLKRTATEGK